MGAISAAGSKTMSAQLAVIVTFGSTTTSLNGLYGARNNQVSTLVSANDITVTASGTTYTIANGHQTVGVRYLIISK